MVLSSVRRGLRRRTLGQFVFLRVLDTLEDAHEKDVGRQLVDAALYHHSAFRTPQLFVRLKDVQQTFFAERVLAGQHLARSVQPLQTHGALEQVIQRPLVHVGLISFLSISLHFDPLQHTDKLIELQNREKTSRNRAFRERVGGASQKHLSHHSRMGVFSVTHTHKCLFLMK